MQSFWQENFHYGEMMVILFIRNQPRKHQYIFYLITYYRPFTISSIPEQTLRSQLQKNPKWYGQIIVLYYWTETSGYICSAVPAVAKARAS